MQAEHKTPPRSDVNGLAPTMWVNKMQMQRVEGKPGSPDACSSSRKIPRFSTLRASRFENLQDILAWMAKYDVVDRIMECKQAVAWLS